MAKHLINELLILISKSYFVEDGPGTLIDMK